MVADKQNILLISTYDIIVEEVRRISEGLTREIPEALRQAYETGGQWHDNPHWEHTLGDQQRLTRRLVELRNAIQSPTFVEELSSTCDKVAIGTEVVAQNLISQAKEIFRIVGPLDIAHNPKCVSNGDIQYVSYQSPVGKSLLGKSRGETVRIRLPSTPPRNKELMILEIRSFRE